MLEPISLYISALKRERMALQRLRRPRPDFANLCIPLNEAFAFSSGSQTFSSCALPKTASIFFIPFLSPPFVSPKRHSPRFLPYLCSLHRFFFAFFFQPRSSTANLSWHSTTVSPGSSHDILALV